MMLSDTVSCSISACQCKDSLFLHLPLCSALAENYLNDEYPNGTFQYQKQAVQHTLPPLPKNPTAFYPKAFTKSTSFFKWVGKIVFFFSLLASISTEYCVAATIILSALLCTPVANPFRSIMLRPCNGIWRNCRLWLCPCTPTGNTQHFHIFKHKASFPAEH